MKSSIKTTLVAIALSAAAIPAFADTGYSQLAASAGLTQSEAAGMTHAQIAAAFFNRGESVADRQPIPGAHGSVALSSRNEPGVSLRAFAAANSNRGESYQDMIPSSAPIAGAGSDRMQLAASAGLGTDGAEGRDLTEVAAIFFNRGESNADMQPIGQ